jgi:hypothetical protein
MREAVAEFLPGQFVGVSLEFSANELQPVRLRAAEPLNRQRGPVLGMIGNGQHPAREVELPRP